MYGEFDFCHSPVDFCTHSCAYPHSFLRLTPLTSAPIRTHSCSLPHELIQEYLQENDESWIYLYVFQLVSWNICVTLMKPHIFRYIQTAGTECRMLSNSGNYEVIHIPQVCIHLSTNRRVNWICQGWGGRNALQLDWAWPAWHTDQLPERWESCLDERWAHITMKLATPLIDPSATALESAQFINGHIQLGFYSTYTSILITIRSFAANLSCSFYSIVSIE